MKMGLAVLGLLCLLSKSKQDVERMYLTPPLQIKVIETYFDKIMHCSLFSLYLIWLMLGNALKLYF